MKGVTAVSESTTAGITNRNLIYFFSLYVRMTSVGYGLTPDMEGKLNVTNEVVYMHWLILQYFITFAVIDKYQQAVFNLIYFN